MRPIPDDQKSASFFLWHVGTAPSGVVDEYTTWLLRRRGPSPRPRDLSTMERAAQLEVAEEKRVRRRFAVPQPQGRFLELYYFYYSISSINTGQL